MTKDLPVLLKKLHVILHRSFAESRNLALGQNCGQLHDLADTFEMIPPFLARWDDCNLAAIRTALQSYQRRYPRTAYDYLSVLDMDDQEFLEVFQGW